MAKRAKKNLTFRPAIGRNFAVRPGGGAHKHPAEKRAADKARRDLQERLDDE